MRFNSRKDSNTQTSPSQTQKARRSTEHEGVKGFARWRTGARNADPGRHRSRALRLAAGIGVVLVCACFPLFVSDAIGYVPLLMCLVLMALSYGYMRLCARSLDCTQDVHHLERVRGEAERLAITLRNASPLVMFRLQVTFVIENADGGPARRLETTTTIPGKGSFDFLLDVGFDHVGIHSVGLLKVEVFDPLGLFSRVIPVDERCTVRVLPRLWSIDEFGGSELATSESAHSVRTVLSDDMDYAAVREYQLGDPMKTVHWKMSARSQDNLFTKLFESHTNPGMTILLDFYSEETDSERRAEMYDTLLESAFSVMNFARLSGIRATLVFRDKNGVVRRADESDSGHLDSLIDEMPRLTSDFTRIAASKMLEEAMHDPDAQANFIFMTTELTQDNIEAVIRHQRFRRGMRMMCVLPAHLSSVERKEKLAPAEQLHAVQVGFSVLESGRDVAKAVM